MADRLKDYATAHAQAKADHTRALRTVIEVPVLYGYGETDDVEELRFDPPLKVEVLPTCNDDLGHAVDDWLDPYWDVIPVDERPVYLRSTWVYGPSYQFGTANA